MSFEPDLTELAQNSPLAIVICDKSERILWCNGLFLQQMQLSQNDVIGRLYASLPLEAIDKDAQVVQLFSDKQGEELKFEYWQQNYPSPQGSQIHYFILQRLNQSKLQNMSSRLKNFRLPKRASWVEFLDYEVSRSRRYDNPLSILKMHILVHNQPENFTQEKLQQSIKDTLMDQLRWADMIGHTDQGSYLMVLPETNSDAVSILQQKLKKSLNRQLSISFKELDYQLIFADALWQKHDDSKRLLERAREQLVDKLEKVLSKLKS